MMKDKVSLKEVERTRARKARNPNVISAYFFPSHEGSREASLNVLRQSKSLPSPKLIMEKTCCHYPQITLAKQDDVSQSLIMKVSKEDLIKSIFTSLWSVKGYDELCGKRISDELRNFNFHCYSV